MTFLNMIAVSILLKSQFYPKFSTSIDGYLTIKAIQKLG
jgi:hypothetical protein